MNAKKMKPLRVVVGPKYIEAVTAERCCVCGAEKPPLYPVCLTCYAGTGRLDYPGLIEMGSVKDDPEKRELVWDMWISRVFAARN